MALIMGVLNERVSIQEHRHIASCRCPFGLRLGMVFHSCRCISCFIKGTSLFVHVSSLDSIASSIKSSSESRNKEIPIRSEKKEDHDPEQRLEKYQKHPNLRNLFDFQL
ncbi:hypothetical protein V6N11_078513 [Hibiscus sabdariffa]|uniref:Uncharacterized protein n=1 Tax=Hibiscus sabdariffa TaxID=183260 RepID=A0ABR2TGQ7_9ROSI